MGMFPRRHKGPGLPLRLRSSGERSINRGNPYQCLRQYSVLAFVCKDLFLRTFDPGDKYLDAIKSSAFIWIALFALGEVQKESSTNERKNAILKVARTSALVRLLRM
jgi:hypothetical protein